ncbi:MAG: hypothetical protein PHY73_06330 [Candidatus Omnitrophica bacterium]|nr:hypothetical protein [Candidatus Omnitrophota bacterium]
MFQYKNKSHISLKITALAVMFFFTVTSIIPSQAMAQGVLGLPAVGTMVSLSPVFTPTILRGIRVYPNEPLKFDFIVDAGDEIIESEEAPTRLAGSQGSRSKFAQADLTKAEGFRKSGAHLKAESEKLIKYFLAALTIPEDNLWVNLSPHEQDRIIPDSLAQTDMGTDMLAQDYILKQVTASLMYPEDELGKQFWQEIYKKAYEEYGTTNIPVDTFNKVWIMPEKAEVYVQEDRAFVVESRLKVMLEEDYLALTHASETLSVNRETPNASQDTLHSSRNKLASDIVREIIVPALEKEVNTGKNFASLRQIYNSLILAYWFKHNLKESIVNKVYSDQSKIRGVDIKDVSQDIYNQYVDSFKKGVCDFIKVEYDQYAHKNIPRKYFSGGFTGKLKIGESVEFIKSDTLEGQEAGSAILKRFKKAITIILITAAFSFFGSQEAIAYENGAFDPLEMTTTAKDAPSSASIDLSKGDDSSPENTAKTIEAYQNLDPVVCFARMNEFINKPFAKKLLSLKIEEDPISAARAIDSLINTPFRKDLLFVFAKVSPGLMTSMIPKYRNFSFAEEILEIIFPNKPLNAFYHYNDYKGFVFSERLLISSSSDYLFEAAKFFNFYKDSPSAPKIVNDVLSKDPWIFFSSLGKYKHISGVEETVASVREKSPHAALAYADQYKNEDFAVETILYSAKQDPWAARAYEPLYSSLYEKYPSFKEEMDSILSGTLANLKKEPQIDSAKVDQTADNAKKLYLKIINNSLPKYFQYKENAANFFQGIKPIGLIGFLNSDYVHDLYLASELTGLSPEFIMAAYAQEGGAEVHLKNRYNGGYNSNRNVDTYRDIGIDRLYYDLPLLLKAGIRIKIEKLLSPEKNEGGMQLRMIVIKENQALKGIATELAHGKEQFKKDVDNKWGSEKWKTLSEEQKEFWIYLYYNTGFVSGRNILYKKGFGWKRSEDEGYMQVHENAAKVGGGAKVLRDMKIFKKSLDKKNILKVSPVASEDFKDIFSYQAGGETFEIKKNDDVAQKLSEAVGLAVSQGQNLSVWIAGTKSAKLINLVDASDTSVVGYGIDHTFFWNGRNQEAIRTEAMDGKLKIASSTINSIQETVQSPLSNQVLDLIDKYLSPKNFSEVYQTPNLKKYLENNRFLSQNLEMGLEQKWILPEGLSEMDLQKFSMMLIYGLFNMHPSPQELQQLTLRLMNEIIDLNPEFQEESIYPYQQSPAVLFDFLFGVASRYSKNDIEYYAHVKSGMAGVDFLNRQRRRREKVNYHFRKIEKTLTDGQYTPSPESLDIIEAKLSEVNRENESKKKAGKKGKVSSTIKGGIDFNAENMNVTTKGGEINFNLPLDMQNITSSSIEGFVPIIINITPVTDFMGLLGLDADDEIKEKQISQHELAGDKVS